MEFMLHTSSMQVSESESVTSTSSRVTRRSGGRMSRLEEKEEADVESDVGPSGPRTRTASESSSLVQDVSTHESLANL